jgi:hypothetical protein
MNEQLMTSKKNLSPKLLATIRPDKDIIGGEIYTILVEISNESGIVIDNISAIPQIIPGALLAEREGPQNTELEELEAKKRQIVREMESQVSLAYERKIWRELSRWERVMAVLARNMSTLLPFIPLPFFLRDLAGNFSKEFSVLSIPVWARQALRIEEWADIEQLEREIITYEEESSFLRRAFLLNKEKLCALIEKLDRLQINNKETDNLRDVYTIQPGESISFPFRAKAPVVFRIKDYSVQFLISYGDRQQNKTGTFSTNAIIRFYPSALTISIGVLIGAIGGLLVRVGMVQSQHWFTPSFWGNLVATIVLALAIAFITARTPDSKKPITAEDFIGGFILGVLSGIFSETIIQRLAALVIGL